MSAFAFLLEGLRLGYQAFAAENREQRVMLSRIESESIEAGRKLEREAIVAWMLSRKNGHERMGDVAIDIREGAHEVSDE